jgi:hypothetical protein
MKIPDEFFLGVKDFKKMDTFEFPKGMYRNLTHSKKDEDSIDRIKHWCEGYHYRRGNNDPVPPNWKPPVLKNESISGFKISGFQSRCSTDNKVVEVQDPRGFTLEIPVANLIELLATTTVENGVVKDKCVWGFDRSPVLLDINGEPYKKHEALANRTISFVKAREMVAGKTYAHTRRKEELLFMYFGRVSIKYKGQISYRGPATDTNEINDLFLFMEESERWDGTKYHSFFSRKSLPKLLDTTQSMSVNFIDQKKSLDKNTNFIPDGMNNLYNPSLVEANLHDLNITIKG